MNRVILMGRLTRDPEVRYSSGDNSMAIARYTLAVDRRRARGNNGEQSADFISCIAFGKSAEFAESKNASGASSENGNRDYANAAGRNSRPQAQAAPSASGFMDLLDDFEELPFS